MTESDDNTLSTLLRDAPRAPDTQFMLRTHRVVSVEILARQHRTCAWRAWRRDMLAAAALIAGIPASAWALSVGHVSSTIVQALLAVGLCLWMLVHDWQMPTVDKLDAPMQPGEKDRPPAQHH